MLSLIIADSEIELIPEKIARHPLVVHRARGRRREPEQILLDSNYDHRAMRALENGDRRGRPDIAHICLLIALDSIPSREGELRVHIHTRHDSVLTFDSSTRIPRSQARFYGILEGILSTGEGTKFIGYRRMGLVELVRSIGPDLALCLSPAGQRTNLSREMTGKDNIVAIVGGFPRGDFASPVDQIADRMVSLWRDSLDAWTAVAETISAYRNKGGG
jgi:rRNA small subunit pseudouridine methyltransferase Nep1